MVRVANLADAPALAHLHSLAFDRPWSAGEIAGLMVGGGLALMDEDGFILLRQAAGEAEILTLAVAPAARRRGLGRALVEVAKARLAGADLFLEVAADNDAALALYRGAGFRPVGVRKGYYARPGGGVDALTLKLGGPA